MPLTKMNAAGKESTWALWHITEKEEELSSITTEVCPLSVVNPMKRLEWLSGRALMKSVLENKGLIYGGMGKDEFGKPFLHNHNHQISVTNSYPYVAVQIHSNQSVGIDLEQPKEKLLRIAPRILSSIELKDAGENVTKHCIYWCAKEALYKIYGKRGLHFENQLNIAPFGMSSEGELKGIITVDQFSQAVRLGYTIQPEFVLVYTNFV
jgi:4'-phosphopantetheinyl transferase